MMTTPVGVLPRVGPLHETSAGSQVADDDTSDRRACGSSENSFPRQSHACQHYRMPRARYWASIGGRPDRLYA